jgi:hypothetical protein
VNESFLYFVWQNRLFGNAEHIALTGEAIEIIHPGIRNESSGPDFFDARIRINGILWAGNVEIHVKASDWLQHGHQNDAAYRNVILHVVYEYDCNITGISGEPIPVVQIDFSKDLYQRYSKLVKNPAPVHCSGDVQKKEPFRILAFLHSMAIERLNKKSAGIHGILKKNQYDWEETFYQCLARNFGFHINAVPFEMLARATPLKAVKKHINSIRQTEALFFGQAGLLEETDVNDGYYNLLRDEYRMLSAKFGLQPINSVAWKFAPVRPGNMPSIRIAQFAAVLHHSFPLFMRIIDHDSPAETEAMFRTELQEYWFSHYSFKTLSPPVSKRMGKTSYNLIAINTISPVLYLYGQIKEDEKYIQKALDILETIPPEQNNIITIWKNEGIHPVSALETQAMIQLYRNYCEKRRCIECTIGAMIVKQE